ncbi:MAG: DUF4350 domain-containing protein [Novosphingobium meiothermophilum]
MSAAPAPFSRGTVIGILLAGALAFVAVLWMLGTDSGGSGNDGGGHVGGKGLNGFAGLARMLENEGLAVQRLRNRQAAEGFAGLLILTPPPGADGADIAKLVEARRLTGPTLVVAPKWFAVPLNAAKAKRGWTQLAGTAAPRWQGFADSVSVEIGNGTSPPADGWRAGTRRGRLPDDRQVESGSGKGLVPIVRTGNGKVLAAWIDDGDRYPALAGLNPGRGEEIGEPYPVVLVFEPDLLDNWGLADRGTAMLARDLVLSAAGDRTRAIAFDMTFNGFGARRNLLTLAFEPPFLAATLCLLLAALAVAWRALNRFGPALVPEAEIASGKAALVASSAGLIRRTGRLHLVARPYADAMRDRLALLLGLPKVPSAQETERLIDAALLRRGWQGGSFSATAAALRGARNPHEITRRALALQQMERHLK